MAITQSGTSITFNDSTTQTTAFTGPTTGGRGQVFTSSGTFTIPTGVTALKITVVGGGGGGGGWSGGGNNGAGAGGGGASAVSYLTGLTSGSTLAVTIGGSGTAGNGNNLVTGGTGGTSSVASGTQTISTISCTGGTGAYTNNTNFSYGGNGGTATGGTLNISGGNGGSYATITVGCITYANIWPTSGSSLLGMGSTPTSMSAGIAGKGYGSGGTGCSSSGSSGGAGAAGIVIFEW